MGSNPSSPREQESQNCCVIPYDPTSGSTDSLALPNIQAYESNIISEHITIQGEKFYYPAWKWPGGKVQYRIDQSLHTRREILNNICTAIHCFNTYTPIRLEEMHPRTFSPNYVTFIYHEIQCSSHVGKTFPGQPINIPNWATAGNIMHEIMHALGFEHEHSRKNRDQYLLVNLSTISEDWRHNYLIKGHPMGKYDPDSIMHYNTDRNIEFRQDEPGLIPNRSYFSETDMKALKYVYGTPRCSYEIFEEDYFLQSYYECITCWGENSCYGVCQYCSITCHKGHVKKQHSIQDLAKLKATFVCDCGRYRHNLMLCTKASTDKSYVNQRMFICRTCFDVDEYRRNKKGSTPGVCYPCSKQCHSGHELQDLGSVQDFFCDCGMPYCNLESGCQATLNSLS